MTEPPDLPEGTLTLLFSDIEGSTNLLARLGLRYRDLISRYREVMRAAFARWRGVEMGTEGDSFFVVFTTAGAALAAAAEAQRALATSSWPDDAVVRVRIGVHTGEPVRHEDGYVGLDVHLAARVAAVARGGQVLLTSATANLLRERADVGLLPLGEHRLKDIPQPVGLLQLTGDGLPGDFPPLQTVGASSSMELLAGPMIGRDDDLAVLTGRLLGEGSGIVTLTGAAGVGKTRLAQAAAVALEDRFADGVYFAHLSSARTTDVLLTKVADTLGVRGDDRSLAGLVRHLAPRRVLLILDNLEQVAADAATVVPSLAAAGPGVRVLVTARQPLHVRGEQEQAVDPLPVPAPGEVVTETGAVALFAQRARLVRPSFELDAQTAADVAEIVRAADGLPLAIEIVAARIKMLGPRALRLRLHDVLRLPSPLAGAAEQQRTLAAAIEWSTRLLTPELRRVFLRLSAFDGLFDLDAAVAVAEPDADPLTMLEHVGELVDASLLMAREDAGGDPSLRMLRTVVLTTRPLLDASPDGEETRRRHAEYFAGLAEEVAADWRGAQHLFALDRMENALENVRAALAWTLGGRGEPPHDVALGMRICAALGGFWYGSGYQTEGREWLSLAIERSAGLESPELTRTEHALGVLLQQHGEHERAAAVLERCLAAWRATGDLAMQSRELNALGLVRRSLGFPDEARALLQEAVALAERAGDRSIVADAQSNLATLAQDEGDYDEAIRRLTEVLAIDTELADEWGTVVDHVNIASALVRAGRDAEAEAELGAHAADALALGDLDVLAEVLEDYAVLRGRRGDAVRAARLAGLAEALRERAELPLSAQDRAWWEGQLGTARAGADPAAWAADLAAGRTLTPSQGFAEALGG